MTTLRIGTRGSRLALAQTDLVVRALSSRFPNLTVQVKPLQTNGDRKQGDKNAQHDKKDWVIDLENALLRDEIDLAVHSGKDIPLNIEAGTGLVPLLVRADPRDSLVSKHNPKTEQPFLFDELPIGARIGTSSVRRGAMLRHKRADLEIVELRGNVPTRLRKFDEDEKLDGIVLAEAGLQRLGYLDRSREKLVPELLLPAINQGMIVAQHRSGDISTGEIAEALSFADTLAAFKAERACAAQLNGDCCSAIGNFALVENNLLYMRASVYSRDGMQVIYVERRGFVNEAESIGAAVGQELVTKGADELLRC